MKLLINHFTSEVVLPQALSFAVKSGYSFAISFIFLNKFIYLFLFALGLRGCAWAFSSCGERGLLFLAVCGLLVAVASLVAEHGSRSVGFSSCGTRA